ncbi:minichromosome maintenance domain-containing protein 2 [Petromyzon marinus]|uniref:minichromosome maintenance domain-containing protein 2 n=1 Tax=Petromyzon marinus TaxID=7757 RepID=UPI003F721078
METASVLKCVITHAVLKSPRTPPERHHARRGDVTTAPMAAGEAELQWSLREAALGFLDRDGGLASLIAASRRARRETVQSAAVFRFVLKINPCHLTECDARLGNMVLNRPIQAMYLFRKVVFLAIKALSLMESIECENQILIVQRLSHVPQLPAYTLSAATFPRGLLPPRFFSVEGVVVSVTTITQYTQSARFLCSERMCPAASGYRHIRIHSHGANEASTMRSNFTCSLCGASMDEDVKCRTIGDKQLVEVVDPAALATLRGAPRGARAVRHQAFTVFLRDELTNKAEMGGRYIICGIPGNVGTGTDTMFCMEASNVQMHVTAGPRDLPAGMKNLHARMCGSPWAFAACLAHAFAAEATPPGTYSALKLVLLLSLLHTSADGSASKDFLDLLVIGRETLVIGRLLSYAAGLVERGVQCPPSGELLASVSRDEHGTATASIHAGHVLLAKGGICCIGETSSYKKEKLQALQNALESRLVSVPIPKKKFGEEVAQEVQLPMSCSVWALGGDSAVLLKKTVGVGGLWDDAPLGTRELGLIPLPLADSFGLIVFCEGNESSDDGACRLLAEHTLNKAMLANEPVYSIPEQITTRHFEELVEFARAQPCELCPSAEQLIQGYYLSSRRLRASSTHGSNFPSTALRTLMSVARAHARLSLRSVALEADAVIAIALYEISITSRHGTSALQIVPPTVFPSDLSLRVGYEQRDIHLSNCHRDILHFCTSFMPEMIYRTIEE